MGNSQNFQFGKFKKIRNWEIPKVVNLENSKNDELVKFQKFTNF